MFAFFQAQISNRHKCYSHLPHCSAWNLWKYLLCLDREKPLSESSNLLKKEYKWLLPQYTHLWYERSGKKAHTINQLLKEKVRQKSLSQTWSHSRRFPEASRGDVGRAGKFLKELLMTTDNFLPNQQTPTYSHAVHGDLKLTEKVLSN